jgi:hypothetical protein
MGTLCSLHLSLQQFRVPAPPSLHRVPLSWFPGFLGTMRSSDFLSSIPRRASLPSRVGYRRRALVRFRCARARRAWTWTRSSAALPILRRRRRISQVPVEPHVCNPPRSMTPAGPSRSGQTTRVGAAPALAYGGRSKRLCFRGSITQQLHSLCTLRSAGLPTTTQHSVPGGGHLSRAAVETLQGSFERFQFFIILLSQAWPGAHADQIGATPRWVSGIRRSA